MKTEAERWGIAPQTDKETPSGQLELGDTIEVRCIDAFNQIEFSEAEIIDKAEIAFGIYFKEFLDILKIDLNNKEQLKEIKIAEKYFHHEFYFKFKALMKAHPQLEFLLKQTGKIGKNGATTKKTFEIDESKAYYAK